MTSSADRQAAIRDFARRKYQLRGSDEVLLAYDLARELSGSLSTPKGAEENHASVKAIMAMVTDPGPGAERLIVACLAREVNDPVKRPFALSLRRFKIHPVEDPMAHANAERLVALCAAAGNGRIREALPYLKQIRAHGDWFGVEYARHAIALIGDPEELEQEIARKNANPADTTTNISSYGEWAIPRLLEEVRKGTPGRLAFLRAAVVNVGSGNFRNYLALRNDPDPVIRNEFAARFAELLDADDPIFRELFTTGPEFARIRCIRNLDYNWKPRFGDTLIELGLKCSSPQVMANALSLALERKVPNIEPVLRELLASLKTGAQVRTTAAKGVFEIKHGRWPWPPDDLPEVEAIIKHGRQR